MKSFSAIGIDALKKIFEERKFKATMFQKGVVCQKEVEAKCEIVVLNDTELNLTTRNFATLSKYEKVRSYQWSIRHGLKELVLDKKVFSHTKKNAWGETFDNYKTLKTLGDIIFFENKRFPILEYISHIILEYQLSPKEFKVFIYPLTENIAQSFIDGSIKQEVEFKDDIPVKVTTL